MSCSASPYVYMCGNREGLHPCRRSDEDLLGMPFEIYAQPWREKPGLCPDPVDEAGHRRPFGLHHLVGVRIDVDTPGNARDENIDKLMLDQAVSDIRAIFHLIAMRQRQPPRSPVPRADADCAQASGGSFQSGCVQQVFAQRPGVWYLPSARRCRSTSPPCITKTETALCRNPRLCTSTFSTGLSTPFSHAGIMSAAPGGAVDARSVIHAPPISARSDARCS